MSKAMDKLERAKFLAVQRLRRDDHYAADLLDHALLIQGVADGAATIHCTKIPEGDPLDLEIGEISCVQAELASEEELANLIAESIRSALEDGSLPRVPVS